MQGYNQNFQIDLTIFNLPSQLILQLNCLLYELSIEQQQSQGQEDNFDQAYHDYESIVKQLQELLAGMSMKIKQILKSQNYYTQNGNQYTFIFNKQRLKSKNIYTINNDFLSEKIIHNQQINIFQFMKILYNQIPSFNLMETIINLMLDTVNHFYNNLIHQTLLEEGLYTDEKINQLITYLEELYILFDSNGVGYIKMSGIIMLFQFLKMQRIVDVKFQQFLYDINGYKAKLTLRQFKRFFLKNKIAQKHNFFSIKEHIIQFQEDYKDYNQKAPSSLQDHIYQNNFIKLINRQPQIQKHSMIIKNSNLEKIRKTDIYINSLYLYGLIQFEEDFVDYKLGLHPTIDYYDKFNEFYSFEFIEDILENDYGDFFFILQQNYQVVIDEIFDFDQTKIINELKHVNNFNQIKRKINQNFDDENQNKFFDLLSSQFNTDVNIGKDQLSNEELQNQKVKDKKDFYSIMQSDFIQQSSQDLSNNPKQNLSKLFEESQIQENSNVSSKIIDLKQFKKSTNQSNQSIQSIKTPVRQPQSSSYKNQPQRLIPPKKQTHNISTTPTKTNKKSFDNVINILKVNQKLKPH